jgi:Zn-dependent proteases
MVLMNFNQLIRDPLGFLKQLACILPIMLISLTLHEWGHAFAAYKCGDPTARNLGRMTLNPLAHIDPYGLLMIVFVGFGWAKPVPVNSRNYRNYKKGEAIVSLAGVTMNLLLAVVFSALFVLFFWLSQTHPANWLESDVLWTVLQYGIALNIALFLFNLLPFYPLDGYHIFELLFARRLPFKVLNFLRRYGQFILIALLLTCRLLQFHPIGIVTDRIILWLIRLAVKLI